MIDIDILLALIFIALLVIAARLGDINRIAREWRESREKKLRELKPPPLPPHVMPDTPRRESLR